MVYLKTLFDARAWYDLIPDLDHTVVTRGLGESRGLDYLAATRARDGSTVIAYMPTCRAVTIDMSSVSGDVAQCSWFDPVHRGVYLGGGVRHEGLPRLDAAWRGRLGAGPGRRMEQLASAGNSELRGMITTTLSGADNHLDRGGGRVRLLLSKLARIQCCLWWDIQFAGVFRAERRL